MPEVGSQTLEFVGRELNAALADGRTALENYVEQPENISLLERCLQELHQVQGVLRVLEIYGAALLAEEMEQVASYLVETASEKKNQAESLDALMRAMVQLPSYLERVLAGGRDLALVLLPLLNDLRAVRGSALLSEGTLLLLNLKSDKQAQPVAAVPGEPPLTLEQWARRLRGRFQVGLIGWIRGERVKQNLDILAAVAQKLEQIATRQPTFQLWWVVGAVIEALQEEGLQSGVSIKRLLGLADREIKRLYEQGEATYAHSPAIELLNNLLYYVGRADSSGPRVSAVRASFRLSELLPVDESVEQERENLSAPSVKLMQTVAAAIREDLSKVKDVLDIFVRRGSGQPQELASQVEMLRKIGDTLGVLGLGELRSSVQFETERLEKIVAGDLGADEDTLVEIAATLIGVEDKLDDRLVGMILPRANRTTDQEEDADFQVVQSAVLRECILNLARVKEVVSQNVGGTLDASGLDTWLELMRGLKAGLLMLGKARAVEVIESVTIQLKRVMQPGGGGLPHGFMDRLADAIVSIEYYMETLQAGRSDPWYMLDNAQTCLQALEGQPAPVVPTVPPLDSNAYAKTVHLAGPSSASAAFLEIDSTATDVRPSPPTLGRPAIVEMAGHDDPELVNLFIEEAGEELERIAQYFPVWDQNPLERDALVTVRRSFHTLKGSGRMVGKRAIAEFAWSIENLLNRVLDSTLVRTPPIAELLRDAVAALPELVEELQTGATPRTNVASIIARAHALAGGKPTPPPGFDPGEKAPAAPAASPTMTSRTPVSAPSPALTATHAALAGTTQTIAGGVSSTAATQVLGSTMGPGISSTATTRVFTPIEQPDPAATAARRKLEQTATSTLARPPAPSEPPPSGPPARDDVLRDIYARETSAHAATVRAYLDREAKLQDPHALPEDVYRACHTLSGSSKMAEARHGIRLAEPLDHWLRRAFSSGIGLHHSDLALLADCMSAMEMVASNLDETTGFFVTHDALRARIAKAEHELDERTAAAAAVGASVVLQPVADEEPEQESMDYDPEVAAIFTDEATELIDVCESALAAWRDEPSNAERRSELKRPLHTLKGGARMANIVAMGDLSHELETLVLQVDSGMIPLAPTMFDVAQSSLDELARMRDAVANGRPVPSARNAIARIHALSRPGSAPVAPVSARAQAPAETPSTHARSDFSASANAAPAEVDELAATSLALAAILDEVARADEALGDADETDTASEAQTDEATAVVSEEPAATAADTQSTEELERLEEALRLEEARSLDEALRANEPPALGEDAKSLEEIAQRFDEPVRSSDSLFGFPETEPRGVVLAFRPKATEPPPEEAEVADLLAEEDSEEIILISDSGEESDSDDGDLSDVAALAELAESLDLTSDAEHIVIGEETPDADATSPGISVLEEAVGEEGPSDALSPAAVESVSYGVEELLPVDEGSPFESLEAAVAEAADEAPVLDDGRAFERPAAEAAFFDSPVTPIAASLDEQALPSVDDAFVPPLSEPIVPPGASLFAEVASNPFAPSDGSPFAESASMSPDVAGPSASDVSASKADTASRSAADESNNAAASNDNSSSSAAPTELAASKGEPSSPSDAAPKAEAIATPAVVSALLRGTQATDAPPPRPTFGSDEKLAPPLPVPPGREPVAPAERQEMARVDAELLDQLLNISGEASISRSRLEQQIGSIDFNLGELSRTVTRLKEQLRKLEIETEAQILHRHEEEVGGHRADFDPLELDRYSSIQQFSRALAETANDVASIQQLLETLASDTQNILQVQARTITELQNGLMRTRMVPFQRHVQRLARIVRQAASDTHKRAELVVEGASGELDRQVLERMLPPFEHMLRNAVVHGIEKPAERAAKGKPETGRILLELHREGAEVMVRLIDDGAGMNLKAIREKGAKLGLIQPGQTLSDEDAMQLVLEPGFSTAGSITQQAGRGVGMDVVATEIKKLGGALHMETKAGEGTKFTIRLPFTLAISHALVVRTNDEYYALPLPTIEGVLRLSKQEVLSHLGREASMFDYGGQGYRFQHLATFVGLEPAPLPDQDVTIPVVLVRAGEHSTGLVADELVGSREIVVKSVGPHISSIRGISGATILGDGRIVVILDIGELVRSEWRGKQQAPVVQREKRDERVFAMVVDDSITVRRVTQRLLERNGLRVLTARDGMDAVTLLQDNVPDIILLDIEMPRMDGYEVAAHVRNDPRLKDVPIIMITSRTGEKHRARAIELGVDDYLGKPYQEAQLLEAIAPLVERHRALQAHAGAEFGEARA